MGVRVECDWCREPIKAGATYMTIELDGKIIRDSREEEIAGPARVYCGEDCGGRLMALLDANPGGRVDMGLEWRLVPVAGEEAADEGTAASEDVPARQELPVTVAPDADLGAFFRTFTDTRGHTGHAHRVRRAFREAGITSLEQAEGMSDRDLLHTKGIGLVVVDKLRAFSEARGVAAGLSRVRQVLRSKGWSQARLAKLAGVNEATVSRIANGYVPSEAVRSRIAQALDRQVEELWPELAGVAA